jgi:hypothetical protein
VRIEGAEPEWVSRYRARPPFAVERLEQLSDDQLVYRFPKPQPDGRTELRLTPLELIERVAARATRRGAPLQRGSTAKRVLPAADAPTFALPPRQTEAAALISPPRPHRHRYHGVLAPNSPQRAQVTALARPATPVLPVGDPAQPTEPLPRARRPRFAWLTQHRDA